MLRVEVKAKLLRWARERSGVSADFLTPRFPKLEAWERGEAHPTLKQLEAFAKATYTPVGFFFLAEPLDEPVPIPDFRTTGVARPARLSPHLLETIYLCQQRQAWYQEYARLRGEDRLPFVASARVTSDVVTTARQIRGELGLDLDDRKRAATWQEALRQLIEQVEAIGVLVMVSGIVGSNNTRKLNPKEFRGLALCDDLAPLIFVNGADAKAAQMFSVAQELAHIWVGETALSDADVSTVPEHAVERWCNQVAAEVLVPLETMRAKFNSKAVLDTEIQRLARHFKVSSLVVIRRIFDAGGLSATALRAAYAAELDRLRPTAKSGGGHFHAALARVGNRFARAMVVRTLEGQQSFTEAFRLLGIKKVSTLDDLGHRLGVG